MAGVRRGRVAGILLVAVLVGCGEAAPDEEPDAGLEGSFRRYLAREIGEDYRDLHRVRHDREQSLLAACLAESGFEHVPVPFDAAAWEVPTLADRIEERRAGYQVVAGVPTAPPQTAVDPNASYRASLGPAAAMEHESAVGACSSRAHELADAASADLAFGGLWRELREGDQLVLLEPAVRAAVAGWAECMSGAGYPGLEHLDDAMSLVERTFADSRGADRPGSRSGEDFRAWELRVAGADADCQETSGAWAAILAAENAWQDEVAGRRADEVAAYVTALREELAAG